MVTTNILWEQNNILITVCRWNEIVCRWNEIICRGDEIICRGNEVSEIVKHEK